jgi:DNA-binding CsgD family transcriptional regulator/PAS domain-containing protein
MTEFESIELAFPEFDKLLGLIYEGPLESVPWQASLELIRSTLQANHALLILRPTSPHERGLTIHATDGRTLVTPASYYDYGYAMDPFVGLPEDKAVTVDELIGERWVETEFYRQFVESADIRYIMGANMRTAGGIDCRIRICRPERSPTFSKRDKALLQVLVPHFKRAVHLHANLDVIQSERELYAATVDQMRVGTLIFDEGGNLLRCNSVAKEILEEKDGVELAGGMLKATYYPKENQELQRLFKQALEVGGTARVTEAVALTRPSGRAKLGVVVRAIPMSEWSEGQRRPSVAVFLRDPDRKSDASAEVMRRLFDLTPAEGELALLLSSGQTLDEAAESLGIRKNTARAHLRSIFSKTGVSRQTELIHVLLNGVMNLH